MWLGFDRGVSELRRAGDMGWLKELRGTHDGEEGGAELGITFGG
jgi:hypothetical protein